MEISTYNQLTAAVARKQGIVLLGDVQDGEPTARWVWSFSAMTTPEPCPAPHVSWTCMRWEEPVT